MVSDTLPSKDASTTKFGIPTSKNIGDMHWTQSGADRLTDSVVTMCLPRFLWGHKKEPEDLEVLRLSPDPLKIGQVQLQIIMEQILFYHIWELQPYWSSNLNNLMNNPSNSPKISEKKMFS